MGFIINASLTCPRCSESFNLKVDQLGNSTVNCPQCRGIFKIYINGDRSIKYLKDDE